MSKILRKREELTNGMKRRIDNLLIPKTICVFAISLARANLRIVAVRVASSLEERSAFGLGQMRMHLAISALEWRGAGRSRVTEGDERSELALDGPARRCYRVVHFSRATLGQFSRALKVC